MKLFACCRRGIALRHRSKTRMKIELRFRSCPRFRINDRLNLTGGTYEDLASIDGKAVDRPSQSNI